MARRVRGILTHRGLHFVLMAVTTAGYGHSYPVTTGGRCVAVVSCWSASG